MVQYHNWVNNEVLLTCSLLLKHNRNNLEKAISVNPISGFMKILELVIDHLPRYIGFTKENDNNIKVISAGRVFTLELAGYFLF